MAGNQGIEGVSRTVEELSMEGPPIKREVSTSSYFSLTLC